jgi:hypothetical protein
VRPDHLLNDPVTVVRRDPGDPDRYNQPEIIETRTTVGAHVVRIRTHDVPEAIGNVVTDIIDVFLPANTTIDDVYAIEVKGETYEVYGRPAWAWNPRLKANEYVLVRCRNVSL